MHNIKLNCHLIAFEYVADDYKKIFLTIPKENMRHRIRLEQGRYYRGITINLEIFAKLHGCEVSEN